MTDEITCKTKKWGGSLGIVIPKEVVERDHIKPNEELRIIIRRLPLARDLWNLGPIVEKESTQRIKDEMRRGW